LKRRIAALAEYVTGIGVDAILGYPLKAGQLSVGHVR
jgi:hypothetical protein